MSFEEYLQKLGFKGWAKYIQWVNEVCDDYNITTSNLTLSIIDGLIEEVKGNDAYYRNRHGNSHVSALKKYKEYLLLFSTTIMPSTLVKNNPVMGFEASYKTPTMGADKNGYFVRYEEDIKENERIPELCQYLENEYERILGFTNTIFGEHLRNYRRIPVILKKKLPVDIYYNDDDYIARMLKKEISLYGNNITENEIKRILEKRKMTHRVTGRYFANQAKKVLAGYGTDNEPYNGPYIVIYYRNFNTTDLDKYLAQISQTLAHEYMHFIHNLICGKNFVSNEEHAKDVKEAIADFFAVMYSINSHNNDKKLEVAEDRYKSWVDNFGSNWPYANALYFLIFEKKFLAFNDKYQYYEDNCCIDKFFNVVDTTIYTMEKAYFELIK